MVASDIVSNLWVLVKPSTRGKSFSRFYVGSSNHYVVVQIIPRGSINHVTVVSSNFYLRGSQISLSLSS